MFELTQKDDLVLPIIPFDVGPIEAKLEQELKKYDGIVFGPEEVKDLKATITELNKAEKMVEDYRKKIKKQAEAPIKEFEAKTKKLTVLINQTRSEFKEAFNKIEDDRKEQRMSEVLKLTKQIIDDSDLFEPYDDMVVFKKEYLNKSMSIGKIEDDLMIQVNQLSQEQEIQNSKVQQIEDKCKILSYELKLKVELNPNGYIELIKYKEMGDILEMISNHAEDQLKSETVVPEPVKEVVEPEPTPVIPPTNEVDPPEVFSEDWTITGTEEQLLMVENFMKSNGITYDTHEDD